MLLAGRQRSADRLVTNAEMVIASATSGTFQIRIKGNVSEVNRNVEKKISKAFINNLIRILGVNQKCQYDEHCIEGAYCMNQSLCQCKEDTPFSYEDGLVCSGEYYQ